jgi:hypothetical protein
LAACGTVLTLLVALALSQPTRVRAPKTHRSLALTTQSKGTLRHIAVKSKGRGDPARRGGHGAGSRRKGSGHARRSSGPALSGTSSSTSNASRPFDPGAGSVSVATPPATTQPVAGVASRSNSTVQDECVPGELGC